MAEHEGLNEHHELSWVANDAFARKKVYPSRRWTMSGMVKTVHAPSSIL
jgi:hypothetical protein